MSMAVKTTRYDTAEYLDSERKIAAYMDAVLEQGDPSLVTHALGVAARARGMAQIARDTGLSRESLYRALSAEGNPELGTVLKVLKALGVRLSAAPAGAPRKGQA
jgi:probable addiction module antidote protein